MASKKKICNQPNEIYSSETIQKLGKKKSNISLQNKFYNFETIQKLVQRKSKISLDNELNKFETTISKISQSTVQKVTAGYIETQIEQSIILINSF